MSDLSSDTPYGEENPRGALPPRKPRKDPRDARAARSAAQTTAKQAEQDARKKATLLQPATEESLLETVESEEVSSHSSNSSSSENNNKGKKKTKAKSSKILPLQWKHRANMWLESVKAGFPHEVEELYERFLLRETTRRSRRSSRRTTTTSSTRSRRPSWIRGPLQSTKPCRYSKSKQHTKRRSSEAASGH